VAGGCIRLLAPAAALIALVSSYGALRGASRVQPCADTEITASIGAQNAAPKEAAPDRLTIVLVGDTGFNPTDAIVEAEGVRKDEKVMAFAETLSGAARDVDGDLAFANLETVITDRNDLAPEAIKAKGAFHFRSHPLALKALMDAGFNLFSLANNHSMDYGAEGVEETLYHMAVANTERAIAYAGIGSNFEEATRPGCLDLGGTRIAFAAIGIITGDVPEHRAGGNKAGQASYRHRPDFDYVVDRLAEMPADYRILSIHYGLEGRVRPDARQIAEWRGLAAQKKGIDLIVGHHPHVVQGVELNGKSLIFNGLGNFMHPGTAEMTRFGLCQDYGLMAKVHLARADKGWKVEAIEAIPLTRTQTRPERFVSPQDSETRILALNHLAAKLDDSKTAKGVRFTPQTDGSGLYCADGAADAGGKVGTLCAGWHPAAPPSKQLARKIAVACQDKPFYGKGDTRRRPRPLRPVPLPSPFQGFRPF
jgi:poly-gamma-glutamate capsule biosynthesis protein CapA/YwtB (metallophosphatase superfamily)